jgi:hypothetical protein
MDKAEHEFGIIGGAAVVVFGIEQFIPAVRDLTAHRTSLTEKHS